jgi:hypothetical protein
MSVPAAVTTIFLAIMTLVDDCHRLRSERMTVRPTSAKGALNWLVAQLGQVWQASEMSQMPASPDVLLASAPHARLVSGSVPKHRFVC